MSIVRLRHSIIKKNSNDADLGAIIRKDVKELVEITNSLPNDADLGASLRKEYNEKYSKEAN